MMRQQECVRDLGVTGIVGSSHKNLVTSPAVNSIGSGLSSSNQCKAVSWGGD